MNCYVCNTEITSTNETEEHIIINAAGGRLKSAKLICIKCNAEFGSDIDSELAKQINSVANMLMIKRHRGEPQPIEAERKSTGEKYIIDVSGKPKLSKPTIIQETNGDNKHISVTARDEKELRNILKGFARKNPHFDVEKAMQAAEHKEEYLNEGLHFQNQIGGDKVFRAVCKCAINYFIHGGGESSQIHHLIDYIKGKEKKTIVIQHYEENLYELTPEEDFHVLHLVGNAEDKTLYCYIDYFNVYKYLVLLNDNYTGADMSKTYCFDLIKVTPIVKKVNVSYDRTTLLDFFSNKDFNPFERIKKSFDHAIGLGLKLQDDLHRTELLERAIQNSLGKYPEGVMITEAMMTEAVVEVMKNITPYLIRRMGSNTKF